MRPTLQACAAGELVPDIALLQVLALARSAAQVTELLERAARWARDSAEPEPLGRLEQLYEMACEHAGAWQIVTQTLEAVDGVSPGTPEEPLPTSTDPRTTFEPGTSDSVAARRLAQLAIRFDRAAELSPEASVALYSLGKPARLAAATAELAERLRDWELLDCEKSYLDIGCGIGRMEQALSPAVRFITGIDISSGMIQLARERCAGLSNVAFQLASGRDLGDFAAASMDVILAVDSFPYLVRCGEALVERHLAEAVRVLKPAGQVAIFNFSYRGDLDADRRELQHHAANVGLTIVRNGVRGLRTWDGAGFHLIK
jgi:SAM-dependent methyltransferase